MVPATVDSIGADSIGAETRGARLLALATRPRITPPDLAALDARSWPEPARQAALLTWSRRAASETESVEVANALRSAYARCDLAIEGFEPAVARLEDDERSHVALCHAFVAAIGGPPARTIEAEHTTSADGDPPTLALLRWVLTGLAICESVSALRFATVRAHTDLTLPRACIDLFLRDETAHARLGFELLPPVLAHHVRAVGETRAARDVADELRATFRHLDLVVGLDTERRGLALATRAQPIENPGVVEPALDALTLYRGVARTVAPRLDRELRALDVSAAHAWRDRWR